MAPVTHVGNNGFRLSVILHGGVAARRFPLNICRPRPRCRRVGGRGVNLVRMVKLTILPKHLGARVTSLRATVLRGHGVSGSRTLTGRRA